MRYPHAPTEEDGFERPLANRRETFLSAAVLPTEEQAAFLREQCGSDQVLRQEVESLLAFDRPGAPVWADSMGKLINGLIQPGRLEGARVGAYCLQQEIGAGGMGVVYQAARADDQYQKIVAVKLVRGARDRASLERFLRERQILATLEHPYIAHLVDGGMADLTPHGLGSTPYLVMEFVKGQPIDQYCRQQRMSLRERVALFQKICEAVSFAHSRLVVHRDLKPSNILVTEDGTPKLLDFGIAKLLSVDARVNAETIAFGSRLTPEYASPEQVRGETAGVGSDVYSLGIVLYELLSGERAQAVNTTTLAELERVICQQDPPPMSRVSGQRELAGDLDCIVAKALRKEPDQRYRSVEQFNEDLSRYLQGLPVRARQGTWLYRSSKFVRRHYGVLTAVATVILALGAGIVMANREAREAYNALVSAHPDAEPYVRGLNFALHHLTYLYNRSGQVDRAAALAREQVQSLKKWREQHPNNRWVERALFIAVADLADVLAPRAEHRPEADATYREARTLAEQRVRQDPQDTVAKRDLVILLMQQARNCFGLEKFEPGLEAAQQALHQAEQLIGLVPGDRTLRVMQADATMLMGLGYRKAGKFEDSAATLAQARQLYARLAADSPADKFPQYGLFYVSSELTDLFVQQKNWTAASAANEKSLAQLTVLVAQNPEELFLRRNLASVRETAATLSKERGRRDEAEQAARECVEEWNSIEKKMKLAAQHRASREACMALLSGQQATASRGSARPATR